MTTNMMIKRNMVCIIAIIMIAFASIGITYAYSSIVNSNGTITAEYLTINVYDGPYSDSPSPDDKFELTDMGLNSDYCIRISSNKQTNAYAYGYFTCNSDIGKLVNYFEFQFTDGNTALLYKDAYKQGLTDNTAGASTAIALSNSQSGVNYYEFQISKIIIHLYSGVTASYANGVFVYSTDEAGNGSSSTINGPITSIDGFNFTFLASRTALI